MNLLALKSNYVMIRLSLLLKRIVQKMQGVYRNGDRVYFEKSEMANGNRCYVHGVIFLSHGNLRGNPDIEINNNVHHVE